eukprot:Amastigsp_a846741_15.p4 type:complete len:102 gc:universal Amastigsp_a846741_15:368-63(-)
MNANSMKHSQVANARHADRRLKHASTRQRRIVRPSESGRQPITQKCPRGAARDNHDVDAVDRAVVQAGDGVDASGQRHFLVSSNLSRCRLHLKSRRSLRGG